MEDKKGGYVSPSQLLRAGGMAAVLGSALLIVTTLLSFIYLYFFSPDLSSGPDDTVMQIRSLLGVFGRMLLVLGLIALYVHHSEAMGILGLIGFLLALFGLVAGPIGAVISLLANLGWALFGLSSLQSGVYPSVAALLLIAGALLTGPIHAFPAEVPEAIFVYASIILYGAIAWMGYMLWMERSTIAE
jgi:hypothetical protein